MLCECSVDIILIEIGLRNVELISNISPKGTHHFIVEFVLVVRCQKFGSYFQTLLCNLIGFPSTHLRNVSIVLDTLMTDSQNGNENKQRNEVCQPVLPRTEEVIARTMECSITRLDVADILIQFTHILLIACIVSHRTTRATTLLHLDGVRLGCECLIGMC